MHVNRLIPRFIYAAAGAVLLLLSNGCVVAPVPLIENDEREVWRGRAGKIWNRAIIEHRKQWYMPIIFSPEGPAKMRNSTTRYSYYMLSYDSKQRVELPFLQLEVENELGRWIDFETLGDTPYVVASRIVRREDDKEPADYATAPVRFEFIVFEQSRQIWKHVFDAVQRPGSTAKSNWDRLRISPDYRTVDYHSASGPRRYRVVENTDEPLVSEDKAK